MGRESARVGAARSLAFLSGRGRTRTNVIVRRKPRSSLAAAAVAVVASLCLPATVHAQHYARFQEARDAYLQGEYAHVVDVLEPLIGGEVPEIQDEILLRESRKYLGAAYVLTGQATLGRQQFEALLRAEGAAFDEYELDAAAFPSTVHAAFDAVRQQLIEQREAEETALGRRRQAEERRRHAALLELVELAQEDEVEIPHDEALAWVPFGVGQFQNGDTDLGWFFAVSEVASFALSAAGFSIWMGVDYVDPAVGVPPELTSEELALRTTGITAYAVGAGAFVALAVAGIIQAHVDFRPSHTVRRRRELPDHILEGLDLAIGPGGVSLRLRF